jgi:hypothetical protein
MAKRTTSSATPSASEVKRALVSLRPGEPALDELTHEDQSWLVNAVSVLHEIYEKRETGRRSDSAFCIFAVERGSPYVQFLAPSDANELVCEAVSPKSVPEMAVILGTEEEVALKKNDFKAPEVSPNYSQVIPIANVVDLAYAARLVYRTLKHVYRVANITDVKYKIDLPASTKPTQFARALVNDLNELGLIAAHEFPIPGTETRLQVYMASPARAFVEIKSHGPRSRSEVRKPFEQAESIRRED